MYPVIALYQKYRQKKKTVMNRVEQLKWQSKHFADDPETYVKNRVQEWHNDECNRMHAIHLPMDQRTAQQFTEHELGSTLFARMSEAEQKSVLYSELLDNIRDNPEGVAVIPDYRELERELYNLRDETLARARENVQGRLRLTRKSRNGRVILEVYDPRTEYKLRHVLVPEENEDMVKGKLIDRFPKELFDQVTDDKNLLHDIDNAS